MIERVKNYVLESVDEVKNKVTWSRFTELQSSAILVLVASVIFAIVIGIIDFGFQNALAWFYREF
ncbi:MAG: preprotein translocase subunit SecE [Bacteroidetes bacterium]|nr:preprotein translocase subunit SecE [Bacteroidota bacterium]